MRHQWPRSSKEEIPGHPAWLRSHLRCWARNFSFEKPLDDSNTNTILDIYYGRWFHMVLLCIPTDFIILFSTSSAQRSIRSLSQLRACKGQSVGSSWRWIRHQCYGFGDDECWGIILYYIILYYVMLCYVKKYFTKLYYIIQVFSPPARWGLLDFIRVVLPTPPPPRLAVLLLLLLVLLLLL